MVFADINGVKLAQFSNLLKYQQDINHFVTTRHGSQRTAGFDLNLEKSKSSEQVLKNRRVLASVLELSLNDFVFPIQVHGVNTPRVYNSDRGRGSLRADDSFGNTDGFMTNEKRLCLIAFAADCVPIIFFDPTNKAIAVAHAGWRGTAQRIPAFVVERMGKEFGSNPAELVVGIGPSGGPCCYEVGDDVICEVEKNFDLKKVIKNIDSKTIFDMWEANTITLTESGVSPKNIEVSGICTISQSDIFYSARKGDAERFVAGIYLT